MKKLLALFAVAMLSACGVAEPSSAPGEEAVGRAQSALLACTSCPSGYFTTGYGCSEACNAPSTPDCGHNGGSVNQVSCLATSDTANTSFTFCGTGGNCRPPGVSVDTHYVTGFSMTSGCHASTTTSPSFNNTTTCVPVPSSGTIASCGACPSGWTRVSGASNSACTTGWGYVQELVTCTKSP